MRRRFSVLKRSVARTPGRRRSARSGRPRRWPQTPALAQMQDPDRRLEQLVGRHLEELVPRMRLELLDQRLLVVTAVRGGRALEHGGELAPQYGDLGQVRLVSGVGVEPEEAALADDLAVSVEALDAHVVEVGGAARLPGSWPW